jgi:DNA-directed RNA polymerase subunit RPC12/RpoP
MSTETKKTETTQKLVRCMGCHEEVLWVDDQEVMQNAALFECQYCNYLNPGVITVYLTNGKTIRLKSAS